MPEEEAFAVLVKIMYSYNLRELFKPLMAELGLRMYQLEYMIQVQRLDYCNSLYVVNGQSAASLTDFWSIYLLI